ncbi:hypothetical protein BJ944DRAFT_273037 [Cunninghamella echinulata]|nr:hypothetical protein BJ944DRAFT_273037 [Cunninghamella echinulata]
MEATWDQYKIKPATLSLYTEDATVSYLPSGANAKTSADIRRFYLSSHFSKKAITLVETIQNRVMTNDKLVEELEWTITFHTNECSWLLGNLDDHQLLNVTIKIPVVISVIFDNDLIKTIRVYWDQASVLKQLRVIPDRNKWPIVGAEQVNVFHSTPITSPTSSSGKDQEKKPFAPGRVFAPEEEVYRPAKKYDHKPKRDIFTYQPPEEKPMVAYNPRVNPSFTLAHDDGSSSKSATATITPENNKTNPVLNNKATPIKRNIFAPLSPSEEEKNTKKLNDLKLNDNNTGTRNIFG